MTSISTVGLGDFIPQTSTERIYTLIFILFWGFISVGYIKGRMDEVFMEL